MAHFYTGASPVCALCEASTALTPECQGGFPSLCSEQGAAPLAPLRGYPADAKHLLHTPPGRCARFRVRTVPTGFKKSILSVRPLTEKVGGLFLSRFLKTCCHAISLYFQKSNITTSEGG